MCDNTVFCYHELLNLNPGVIRFCKFDGFEFFVSNFIRKRKFGNDTFSVLKYTHTIFCNRAQLTENYAYPNTIAHVN